VTIWVGICAVLTFIVTKMTITGRPVCGTNNDVTITGRSICSDSSYCDNTDNNVSYICRANSYFDNNYNNSEVYM
jgi:hypothetical protein